MRAKTGDGPDVLFRIAEDPDRPHLIAMINAAFSIETFLDYERTNVARLAAMMQKGTICWRKMHRVRCWGRSWKSVACAAIWVCWRWIRRTSNLDWAGG